MGRKSIKALRRQEIIAAFYKTAKNEGLHNASIAKIAEAIDVNPSLILHNFKNKDELVLALIDYILSRYQKIYTTQQEGSSIDHLHEVLKNLFSRKWNTLISDDVYYSCYSLIFRNNVIRSKYKELHDSLRVWLEQHLVECIKEGSLQIEDPKRTANLIYTILEGAYYYLCMEKNTAKKDEIMGQYKQHAYQILGLEMQ
ncbi:MAG: TetR family transcriptional regulator [Cytophagales bacterium CG12_big_fil_rev_8_21_14_0_65_40_12]|nr:MAG: TetR family transcriptional regulator [Cytophagales bacterium CG12_big_fil_rev_8_21_14_0_65_40_12]PIW03185.1 MAG: TetR family transcriptional regulator [Cytophagales bacterium CG17_big_fil_post_rev_8_21_14_2_50_40_13]